MRGGILRTMKKEQYNEPIIQILCFERGDVVKTSGNDNWLEPVDGFQ